MADHFEADQDPSQREHLDYSNNYYTDFMIENEHGDQSARGIVEKMGEIVLGMTGGKEQIRRKDSCAHLGEQDVFDICFEENWNKSKDNPELDKRIVNSEESVKSVERDPQMLSSDRSKVSFNNMKDEGNHQQLTFHQGNIKKCPQISEKDFCFNDDHCDGHSSVPLLQEDSEKLEEKVFNDKTEKRVVNFKMACGQNNYHEHKDILYADEPASVWPIRGRTFCDNGDCIPSPEESNFISVRSINEEEDNLLYESVCNAMTNYRSLVSQTSYQAGKRKRSRRRQSLRLREVAGNGYDSDESFHSSFSDSTSCVDNYFDVDRYSDEEMPLANDELPEWTLDSSEYEFYDPLEPGDSSATYPYGNMREPRAPPPTPRDGSPPLTSSNVHRFLTSSLRSRSPISIGLSQNEVKTSSDDNVTMPVLSFFHQPLDFWIFEVD